MDQITVSSPAPGSRWSAQRLFRSNLLRNVTLAAALISAPLAMPAAADAQGHNGAYSHGGYRGGYGGGGFRGGYGGWRGPGRYWGGRYYAYGVGPCWRWNPFYARWVWACF